MLMNIQILTPRPERTAVTTTPVVEETARASGVGNVFD